MPALSVLISGASIAGPSLAFWLARLGHHVTVVEKASALRAGGYAGRLYTVNPHAARLDERGVPHLEQAIDRTRGRVIVIDVAVAHEPQGPPVG